MNLSFPQAFVERWIGDKPPKVCQSTPHLFGGVFSTKKSSDIGQ